MKNTMKQDTASIVGPAGRRLRIADLPPANTKRWVIRRKAEVVAAVHAGLITLDQACTRYNLSTEEFASWQRLIESHGVRGLRATRIQKYRQMQRQSGSGDAGSGQSPISFAK